MRPVLLVLCAAMLAGCMQSVAQPGQTPAQVQTCTTDANIHTACEAASLVCAATAGTSGAIAGLDNGASQSAKDAAAVLSAGTGACAVAMAGCLALSASAYANDGCSPALPAASLSKPRWRLADAVRP